MVDVGQFLGLRAAKRAGPSAPAPGRLGIFAAETEPIPQQAVRFSAKQIAALFMTRIWRVSTRSNGRLFRT